MNGGSDHLVVICQITVEKRRWFIMWQNSVLLLCSFIFTAVQRMWFALIVFWRILILLFWNRMLVKPCY